MSAETLLPSLRYRIAELLCGLPSDKQRDSIIAGWLKTESNRSVRAMLEVAQQPVPSALPPDEQTEGWVLVPAEPTEAMLDAGFDVCRAANRLQRQAIYRAMIAAAPRSTKGAGECYSARTTTRLHRCHWLRRSMRTCHLPSSSPCSPPSLQVHHDRYRREADRADGLHFLREAGGRQRCPCG